MVDNGRGDEKGLYFIDERNVIMNINSSNQLQIFKIRTKFPENVLAFDHKLHLWQSNAIYVAALSFTWDAKHSCVSIVSKSSQVKTVLLQFKKEYT